MYCWSGPRNHAMPKSRCPTDNRHPVVPTSVCTLQLSGSFAYQQYVQYAVLISIQLVLTEARAFVPSVLLQPGRAEQTCEATTGVADTAAACYPPCPNI